MLRKWAFIISLIAVLGTFVQVNAVESNADLEITKSENEGDELNKKLEEEASDDDSSSVSESEDIQNAFSFIHPDKFMDVNKDNVSELIRELSQYSNSYMASEEEKAQIKKWIDVLEAKYKKLDNNEAKPKTRKEKNTEKAPKTPSFDGMSTEQLMSAKNSITDEKQLLELQKILRERKDKEKDIRKISQIQREINDIDIKIAKQKLESIKENVKRKTSISQNPNNAKIGSETKTPSSGEEKPSSGNTSNSNSIPSDPFFTKQDLKTILAIDITGLNFDQLNNLNYRLNRELFGKSHEEKQEIRSKIEDVRVARDTKVSEILNRGKTKQGGNGSSQRSSKPGEGNANSTGLSSSSDNSNANSTGLSSSSDSGNANSTGSSSSSDSGNANSTGSSSSSDNSNVNSTGSSSSSDNSNANSTGSSSSSDNSNVNSTGSSSSSDNSNVNSTGSSSSSDSGNANSTGSSSSSDSGNANSTGSSSSSDSGNANSTGSSSSYDNSNANSTGPRNSSDSGNANSTGQSAYESNTKGSEKSGERSNSTNQRDSERSSQSEDMESNKPVRMKVTQRGSTPSNATRSNSFPSVYSIKDTVDRLRVIDISRSSSALDE